MRREKREERMVKNKGDFIDSLGLLLLPHLSVIYIYIYYIIG